MKRNLSRLLQIVAVLFSAIIPVNLAHAQAQLPPDAPLADQLKAQYKVTKFGLDGSGFTVLSPGTILVIQKGGILGVPPANLTMGVAVFKDGDLKQPSAGNRMFLGNVTRFLQVGEKVYLQKVDVNLKTDKVQLTVVECDSCNGVNQPSLFKGVVSFEFAKGSLLTADPATIEDTIAQVFMIDNGNDSNGQQQNQDQNAQQGQQQNQQQDQQQQAAPQQQAPPPEPASIQMGMTVDQVESALGPPDKKVTIGAKIIYVYKDLKVTFTNGKVSDAE
jgi:hypothetical protein